MRLQKHETKPRQILSPYRTNLGIRGSPPGFTLMVPSIPSLIFVGIWIRIGYAKKYALTAIIFIPSNGYNNVKKEGIFLPSIV